MYKNFMERHQLISSLPSTTGLNILYVCPSSCCQQSSHGKINMKTTDDIKGLDEIDLNYYYFKTNLRYSLANKNFKLCGNSSPPQSTTSIV